MNQEIVRKQISFQFSPFQFEDKKHLVEKSDPEGKKHCYLCGVSSGPSLDGHGERMTDKCIKSFMKQANSGNVLLYADLHGIRASEDMGILTKADILDNGDWYTEFRLYDESDDVDDVSVQRAKKLWKQVNGLHPYKSPRQKGFSIEGDIPEGSILHAEKDETGNLSKRVIDDVHLDGVVLVGRPAYTPSVAEAVYKALDEVAPMKAEKAMKVRKTIQESLQAKMKDKEIEDSYYRQRWDIQDALDENVRKIMYKNPPEKQEQLNILFDEYRDMMVKLILSSESLFSGGEKNEVEQVEPYGNVAKASRVEVLKALHGEFKKLYKILEEQDA